MLSLTTADLTVAGLRDADLTKVKSQVFETFCRQQYSSVVNALTWTLGDADLAADAANEAFARAYERWDHLSSERAGANAAGWVYTTGLNWARRRLRRRRREYELTTGFMPPTVEMSVDHLDLRKALTSIPIKYRSVVVLRLMLQHTEAETAAVLGIELGTVKSRLSRGLEKSTAPDVGRIKRRAHQRVVRRRLGTSLALLALLIPGAAVLSTAGGDGSGTMVAAGDAEHSMETRNATEPRETIDGGMPEQVSDDGEFPFQEIRVEDTPAPGGTGRQTRPVGEAPDLCRDEGPGSTSTSMTAPVGPDEPATSTPEPLTGCEVLRICSQGLLLPSRIELVDCRTAQDMFRLARSPVAGSRYRM